MGGIERHRRGTFRDNWNLLYCVCIVHICYNFNLSDKNIQNKTRMPDYLLNMNSFRKSIIHCCVSASERGQCG